jgi:glucose/mannose transport system substrate-binding protein
MPEAGRRAAVTALLSGLVLVLAACQVGGANSGPNDRATKNLEVLSWWTSGSERAALNVLFTDFKKSNPGINVVNAAVSGGGGSEARVVLATRLQDNNPPDVWQTHPGSSINQFIDQGLIADVSSVYKQDNLASAIPKEMLQDVSRDGKEYGVSTGAHRINVLWFNKKLLAQAEIPEPGSGYTVQAFLADLGKLKAAGVLPLCRSAKAPFATAELFENNLLSVIGPAGWKQLTSDQLRWDGPQVRQALNQFGDMLNYSDPEAGALTWDQATKKLASGGCAFESMNDSAYGELVKDGAKEGTDFGYLAYPGTENLFLTVVDTFVVSNDAKDARNARAFLATIGSKSTQLAFNKEKGSVPLRKDVDVSSLPPYQRASAEAFAHDQVLMSITHGEAVSPQFEQGFYDAIAAFQQSRDVNAFNQALRDAVNELPPPAH